jgi:hypothetical protein
MLRLPDKFCWRNNFIKNDNNTLPFNSKKITVGCFLLYDFISGGTGSGDEWSV